MGWALAQEFKGRLDRQISKHCGGLEVWVAGLGQTAKASSEPRLNATEIIIYLWWGMPEH